MAERSLNKLKISKNYIRTKMSQEKVLNIPILLIGKSIINQLNSK